MPSVTAVAGSYSVGENHSLIAAATSDSTNTLLSDLGAVTTSVSLFGPSETSVNYSTTTLLTNDSTTGDGTLSVSAVNGDSTAVGVLTTLTSGAKLLVSSDGSILYIAATGATNTETFTYTATDGVNSGTATATIQVVGVTLTSPGDQSNFDGDTVNLAVSATDSAGNALTYSASGLPSGLAIDSGSGVIAGTIASNADASGPYLVTITGTDQAANVSASETINWTVNQPTVTLTSPGDQSNFYGDQVAIPVSASDSAGHALEYSTSNLPPGLSIDQNSGMISGIISSEIDDTGGSCSTTVTVTDGAADLSASQTITWTVTLPTVALTNPYDQTNEDGDPVNLAMTATDSAGHALTFSASNLPAGLSIDPNSGAITGTISSDADVDSPYSVGVTATDANAGVSAIQNFAWIVGADATTVSLVNPGTVSNSDGDSVNLTLMGLDSVGDPLTYSATGLPAGLSVDGSQIVGTLASNADAASPYTVTATATDTRANLSASQTFVWAVMPLQPTVSLTNPGNETNVDGDTVAISLVGSDSTGDPLTFGATGLPPGLTLVGNQISGTIAAGDAVTGPYPVQLTATDAEANVTATQNLTWFCSANAAESDGDSSLTALSSSPNPSQFGQWVTLTAGASGGENAPLATGYITFMDGTTNLGTVQLVKGQAVLTTSSLAIGSHNLTAVYSGDATYAGSVSPVVDQSVTGGIVAGTVWIDANSNGLLDNHGQRA